MNDRIEIVMDDHIEIGAWASVDDSEGNLGSYLNCGELGFETYAPGDVLLGRFIDKGELIRALEGYRESPVKWQQVPGGGAELRAACTRKQRTSTQQAGAIAQGVLAARGPVERRRVFFDLLAIPEERWLPRTLVPDHR